MSFEELNKPCQENVDTEHYGEWFVAMKHMRVSMTGLLTVDGRGIVHTISGADHTHLYFNSEVHAHNVASLYYLVNGMSYPYMDEWDAALKAEFNNSVPVGAGTATQSEVMDFI